MSHLHHLRHRSAVAALHAVLSLVSPRSFADWLAVGHDQSRNPYVTETLRPPLALKWRAPLTGIPEQANLTNVWVVEHDGVVCVLANLVTPRHDRAPEWQGRIWGFDSETGASLWPVPAGTREFPRISSHLLSDGRLLIGTWAGAAALDAKSGRWLWRQPDERCDGRVADAGGALLCGGARLDRDTGEIVGTEWGYGEILYRGRFLLGLLRNGKHFDNGYGVMDAETGQQVDAIVLDNPSGAALVPSLAYGDLLFGDVGMYQQGRRTAGYIGGPEMFERNRGLCAFRVDQYFPLQTPRYARGYERVWYRRNRWGGQVICVDPRAVYGRLYRWFRGFAPGDSAVYALDPGDASTLWRSRTLGNCGVGSYSDADYGNMFVLSGDVLWGWSPDAALVSVDARNGTLLDRDRTVRATKSAELVVSRGRLFMEMDGALACFAHDPTGRLPQGVTGVWWRPFVVPDPDDWQPRQADGSVEVLIGDRTALSLRWAQKGPLEEQYRTSQADAEQLGPLVAPERTCRLAWIVADRLQDLLDEGAFDPDHLHLTSEGPRVAIRHNDRVVLCADPVQARLQQSTVWELAQRWVRGIEEAFGDA